MERGVGGEIELFGEEEVVWVIRGVIGGVVKRGIGGMGG